MIDAAVLASNEAARRKRDTEAAAAKTADGKRIDRDLYASRNAPVLAAVIGGIKSGLVGFECQLGSMGGPADFASAQVAIVAALQAGISAVGAASPRI